jgi:hypothetical protein
MGAYFEAWRRVLGAPWIAFGILIATAAIALPLASTVGRSIETHLGASLEAERAAEGWHAPWAAEFVAQAQGAAETMTHEILGFGATLAMLSDLADREPVNRAVAWTIAAYLLLWTFLAGGVLDRFARGRPIRAHAFFAACGVYFFRFLRLAVFVGVAYWWLFQWLHPLLFQGLFDRLTRDMTSERTGAILRIVLYLVFFGGVALVSIVSDYAKARAVVEDRRSMLGAIGAAVRFVRRRWPRVLALFALNVAGTAIVLGAWAYVAPSASAPVWFALLVAQAYLLLRLWSKLVLLASSVTFFQQELAHAEYTAAPLPVWPDSPAAEAISD